MTPDKTEHINPEYNPMEDYDPIVPLAEYYDTLEHHGEWHDITN